MAPKGHKKSGDVAGGRVVATEGPGAIVSALVRALRAGGEITRATHRFHTYPARAHPDAARALLAALPGERVLDPFCGGGTFLVEAMLAGRQAIGRDLNPVAVLVARARTRLLSRARLSSLRQEGAALSRHARDLVRDAVPPAAVVSLASWYGRHALAELSALHALVESVESADLRGLLRAAHSSLVVKYSQRASDTSARRVDVEPRRGAVLTAFRARVEELARMLGGLRTKVAAGVAEADVAWGDARSIDVRADLVCTSPPYPGTYDYLPLQHLRLAWLGALGSLEGDVAEIGARRDFRDDVDGGYRRWRGDTERWLGSAAAAVDDGNLVALLIGDGIAQERLLEARAATIQAASRTSLSLHAAASIERVDPATRLAKREHALVFEKSSPTRGSSAPAPNEAKSPEDPA